VSSIHVEALKKTYGAVQCVGWTGSGRWPRGRFSASLGRTAPGKTTTLRILTGLAGQLPDSAGGLGWDVMKGSQENSPAASGICLKTGFLSLDDTA